MPVAPRSVAQDAISRPRAGLWSRGTIEVCVGAGLLVLSGLLTLRASGAWFSDAIVWPAVLVAAGAALLWRRSSAPATVSPPPSARATPEARAQRESKEVRERAVVASRTGIGIALVLAAALAFLQALGALSAARDVLLAVLVAVVALGVIFAPLVIRMTRSLTAERSERIRSQERAEVAAHLHDSVLQTLAMVQRRSGDAKEVEALARRQERELRSWLDGRTEERSGRFALALEDVAAEVEEAHGVPVEVVAVGDRELDATSEALVAAAREAMINAAKFGHGRPVSVYAELGEDRAEVFVRDHGPGFDPDDLPEDRRGVRESIVGRMRRHGGEARFASTAEGTEVQLVMEEASP